MATHVSDATLDLLIGTYRASEGPKMPIHYRDLLAALIELKELRAEYKELKWRMDGLEK